MNACNVFLCRDVCHDVYNQVQTRVQQGNGIFIQVQSEIENQTINERMQRVSLS